MTPEEWSDVGAAVADALEREASAREAFVRLQLAGRDSLIREALSLLAYDGENGDDPVLPAVNGDWTGRRVGSYVITGKAGEGGMGVVWTARRDDGQFERCVAVKFLSGFSINAFSIKRFLRERDILARLDHPHIARLLDAGFVATPWHGRLPYLVLEWVDGVRVDQHVRDSRLACAGILRVFLQLCSAVEYAHGQLIVHRDVKPSNILVTPAGEAKLLDFGIAKILDAGSSPADGTATIARALTLDYSSPEQLRGERVTTADDVYSLGVLLFELLTGERPFRWSGKTLAEIVTQAGETPAVKPSAIRAGLARELDAIVAKAIGPEAGRRYRSVSEMAGDIENFLAGRPVKAQATSTWYVARKFVFRHRWAVTASLASMAIIGGSAAIAVRQKIQAEHRFEQLRQLAHAVIFEYQADISRLPGTLAVRQKMVQQSLAYLDSLTADAGDDPQLLSEVAKGYRQLATAQGKYSVANLGDFPAALVSIRKAHAVLDRLLALRPGDFDAACELGDVLFDTALIQVRVANEDFQATRRQAIEYWEELAKKYPDRERARSGLAAAAYYKGDYEHALILYEQLAAQSPSGDRDYRRNVALMCRTIATEIGERGGDSDRMRRLAERAVEIDEGRLKARPLDRGLRLDLSFDFIALEYWYELRRDYRDAVQLANKAVAMREELVKLAPDDEQAKDRLMFAWNKLASLHRQLGEDAESALYYRRSVALGEEMARHNTQPNQPFQETLAEARQQLASLEPAQ